MITDEPDRSNPPEASVMAAPALVGGGMVGDLVRAGDWGATALGPLDGWPVWMRSAVVLCFDMVVPAGVYCGSDLRFFYNDDFAPFMADRHPWALGRPAAEIWSDIWEFIEPQLTSVLTTGQGCKVFDQRFELLRQGKMVETYFQYSFNPVRDGTGRVVAVFTAATETTERVLAERRRVAENERLRAMFEQAPGYIAVLSGPDHVYEVANRAYRRLTGDRSLIGRPVREVVPELADRGFVAHMDRVYATGEPYMARREPIQLTSEVDGSITTYYFDYIYQPITDASGAVTGLFVEGSNVTDEVIIEQQAVRDTKLRDFRARLAEALNHLRDPVAVMAAASELLGQYLGVARVSYTEIDYAQGIGLIAHDWTDGSVPSMLGVLQLDSFGPIVAELRSGNAVVLDDVATDPRTADPISAASYRAIGSRAILATPLIKEGRIVAVLSAHSGQPQTWSADYRTLALEVAERTWAAVERARAETALRQNESRLATALSVANLGTFVWDFATDTVALDQLSRRIFGFAPDEVVTAADVFGRIIPADLDRVRDLAETSRLTGDPLEVDYWIHLPDGTPRCIVSSSETFRDQAGQPARMIGFLGDITARKLAEAHDQDVAAEAVAAAEVNAKFRALFDQGGFFAAILGLDGTVHEVNRLATEATGFTRDQFIGWKFWECGPWSPSAALVEQMKRSVLAAASGQSIREEMPYFVPDGSERYVAANLTPVIGDAGQIRFVVVSGVDITDRKQAEDALRTLAADLSEADHRKDEFLAMLAHELRNPLGAISGAVQLATATDQPAQLDEFRDLIQRQVVHLTRLIDDLLDVSRITQGKIVLQKATVDLATIVQRAVELVQPVISQKRHTLTLTLPDVLVPFVADPTRTEQILGNLLTNAAKYTEPGGRIDLDARVEGAEVVVRVRDSGVGIAAAMLPEVFGLFTQVDATIDRAQGGLGIGLTLVRNLVEMHGGQVAAASPGKGHGSEFTVRLPIGAPTADSPRISTAISPRKASAEPEPRVGRVLVVDDNLDTARLTARMLRLAGFEVATAHDGLAAVDLAHRLHPTVVLLDIGLPGMNGYEVAAALRQHESCCDATIIAISGYGEEKARERSGSAGFNHHLTKPVDFTRLMSLIDA